MRQWPSWRRIKGGTKSTLFQPLGRAISIKLASYHRARLSNVIFIGITGSAGKTLAKELTADILESAGKCHKSRANMNSDYDLAAIVREVTSDTKFCVLEFAASDPGIIARGARMAKPKIGAITNVRADHYKAYGSLEAIADEKGSLISELPSSGTAVLNMDEPTVMAMRSRFNGKLVTYGCSPEADVRAENIISAWPQPLSFTLVHEGLRYAVQTKLHGEHLVPSVLVAITIGLTNGIMAEQACNAVANFEPFPLRMSPDIHPDGVSFIRDDLKAPLWSLPNVFDFMKKAEAERKILVLGTISDYTGSSRSTYAKVATEAQAVADQVIFVGASASKALRAKNEGQDSKICAFNSVKDASDYLNGILKKGDLVLIKGSNSVDHLGRIALSRRLEVTCWDSKCGRLSNCDTCPNLSIPKSAPHQPAPATTKPPEPRDTNVLLGLDESATVVVGIGNPGTEYANTPHNVGQHALDILADRFGGKWRDTGTAFVSNVLIDDSTVCLVKPQSFVNNTGETLSALTGGAGFGETQLVLLFDDINLPIGKVRARMRGSDGGHRGVRSIITAFQRSDIPRVKIGVKRSQSDEPAEVQVLRQFTEDEQTVVDTACEEAADRLIDLLRNPRRYGG